MCIPACTRTDLPHPGGADISQHALGKTPPPRDGYYCGRYASYWNAFLFNVMCKQHHRNVSFNPSLNDEKNGVKNVTCKPGLKVKVLSVRLSVWHTLIGL